MSSTLSLFKVWPDRSLFHLALALLVLVNQSAIVRANPDPMPPETRVFSRETMRNLREIANSGTLGGQKLRFLVPLESLRRSNDFKQPNQAVFETLDFIDYARIRALGDVLDDARDLFFGHDGVAIDSWSRGELEVLKFDLTEQRARLYDRREAIDPSKVTAQVLHISLDRVQYLLVAVPINYFQRGFHYLKMTAQAGTIIVVGGAAGGATYIALLISYAVKSLYSFLSIGAWSLFYLTHKALLVPMDPVDGVEADRSVHFPLGRPIPVKPVGQCAGSFRLNSI